MKLERSFDADVMSKTLSNYPEIVDNDFNASEWLADLRNIAIASDDSFGVLEPLNADGVYEVHIFFEVRGKEAFDLAIAMLHEVFDNYEVRCLVALTPEFKPRMAEINKQLGFKEYQSIVKDGIPTKVFAMSIDEFKQAYKAEETI